MKTAVIIGRFQPFHHGHSQLIEFALKAAGHLVVVLGSANGPRSLRNPFKPQEREELIRLNLKASGVDPTRVSFVSVRDYFYHDTGWINEVREKVSYVSKGGETFLVGHRKDTTSSYLSWFSDWKFLDFSSTASDATAVRESYLRNSGAVGSYSQISEVSKKWLMEFAKTEKYANLHDEQLIIDAYKASWSKAPFPPILVTTDSMVMACGHLLLVQRKNFPGKNLWALPGGFLDIHEKVLDCSLRELFEETKIELSEKSLKDSLIAVRVFDHPLRSSRGRTITHLHLYHLNLEKLPAVEAADDAAAVKWVPVLDVGKMESEFFEDHFHIISAMIGEKNSPSR